MIRAQYIRGIKQRVIINAQIVSPNGKRRDVRGRSRFEVIDSEVSRKRVISQAIFNAFYVGINRYRFPTGSYIINPEVVGYETPKDVTVKRVNNRGKYRTYVFVKGRRGVVKNIKWSGKTKNDSEVVLDEIGMGKQDHWND